VKTRLPKLTLLWLYEGTDQESRRSTIESLDYPDVYVIFSNGNRPLSELALCIPEDSELCVFWADDGKPIGPGFLRDMVRPLIATEDGNKPNSDMHLWSGNALAMRRGKFCEVGVLDFVFKMNAFMKMALLLLDASYAVNGRRANVVFSTTEHLAPMCAEPVGLPS
jgi:hypothetical protein